jgi:carbon storage regulator
MLVLTRRTGEGIMIGDEIEVKILDVSGEKVRIGIDAPREINVYRTEVFERIASEEEWSGDAGGVNGGEPTGVNGGEATSVNGARSR